jgi:hypothetical protein
MHEQQLGIISGGFPNAQCQTGEFSAVRTEI